MRIFRRRTRRHEHSDAALPTVSRKMVKTSTKAPNMKNKDQVRQGDVLIERISSLPKNLKPAPGTILAHGEVTGHAHEIEDATVIRLFEPSETDTRAESTKFMRLARSTALKHQEHARIPLRRGAYKITRQREYSPEAIRNVAD